jgi:hypothetical protein
MRFEKSHNFSRDEVMARMRLLGEYWTQKYGVRPRWDGDTMAVGGSIIGISFEATMAVGENKIECEGPDPPRLFRKKFEQYVVGYLEHKLGQYLDPKATPDELAVKNRNVQKSKLAR